MRADLLRHPYLALHMPAERLPYAWAEAPSAGVPPAGPLSPPAAPAMLFEPTTPPRHAPRSERTADSGMSLDSAGTALPSGSGEWFTPVISLVAPSAPRTRACQWTAPAPRCRPGQVSGLAPVHCKHPGSERTMNLCNVPGQRWHHTVDRVRQLTCARLFFWFSRGPGHTKAQQRDALAVGDIIALAFYTCSKAAHAKCTTLSITPFHQGQLGHSR